MPQSNTLSIISLQTKCQGPASAFDTHRPGTLLTCLLALERVKCKGCDSWVAPSEKSQEASVKPSLIGEDQSYTIPAVSPSTHKPRSEVKIAQHVNSEMFLHLVLPNLIIPVFLLKWGLLGELCGLPSCLINIEKHCEIWGHSSCCVEPIITTD